MNLKEETERVGHVLQALYPDLFPPTPSYVETQHTYTDALRESSRCRSLARSIGHRLAATNDDDGVLDSAAMRLFEEVKNDTRLWRDVVDLARVCESWNRPLQS